MLTGGHSWLIGQITCTSLFYDRELYADRPEAANFEREADLSSPASHRLLDYRGIDHGSKDFSKVIVARLVSLKRSRVDHRNVGLSAMMAAPASGK